jgi:hypothetical protein
MGTKSREDISLVVISKMDTNCFGFHYQTNNGSLLYLGCVSDADGMKCGMEDCYSNHRSNIMVIISSTAAGGRRTKPYGWSTSRPSAGSRWQIG